MLTGGYEITLETGTDIANILEYDFTADSFTQIGTMNQAKGDHAISVVQYEDFYQWCQ